MGQFKKEDGKKTKKIKSSIKRTAPLIYHELPRHIPLSTKSKFKYVAVVKMQKKNIKLYGQLVLIVGPNTYVNILTMSSFFTNLLSCYTSFSLFGVLSYNIL